MTPPPLIQMQAHLKHLMFNDCVAMHNSGCNHNASDRCTTYEIWYDDIRREDFPERYEAARTTFLKRRAEFDPEAGYYKSVEDIERYAREHGERAESYIAYREEGVVSDKQRVKPPEDKFDDEFFKLPYGGA